jgi:DNA-binding FadR family transcriptional regulator
VSDLSDPARLPLLGAGPKLPDQVAAVLRERVAQGQFAPGARLPSEAQLAEALAALERAVAAGESGVAEDLRFHYVIAEATRNPYYLAVLEFLGQFLHGTMRATRASRRADFIAQTDAEHAAIVAAIERGDPRGARTASARHLVNSIRRMTQAGPEFWARERAAGRARSGPAITPPTPPKEDV